MNTFTNSSSVGTSKVNCRQYKGSLDIFWQNFHEVVLWTDTYVMTVVVVNISKVWRLLRSWPRCYSRKNEYTYISTLSTLTPQGSVASSENIGDVKLRTGTGEVNCQLSAACKHCKHCKQLADWQICTPIVDDCARPSVCSIQLAIFSLSERMSARHLVPSTFLSHQPQC